MPHRKIFVVLANGSRAKVLTRAHGDADLHACLTIEDGPAKGHLAAQQVGDSHRDQRIGAFVEVLAAHLRDLIREQPAEGVILAAPARMLRRARAAIDPFCPVLVTVQKDLMKATDHELAEVLRAELLQAPGALAAP
jgi:hypothetical protein